ncbi:alpha/beta hydrolase, partial [Acinetobacter baumannii]
GNIELPTLWKFERTADPSKHFILKAVTPIETNAAKAEIADKLKAGSSRAMLIYVHGYNMGFEEAALRTAQLSYDLKFPGVAFFYSW